MICGLKRRSINFLSKKIRIGRGSIACRIIYDFSLNLFSFKKWIIGMLIKMTICAFFFGRGCAILFKALPRKTIFPYILHMILLPKIKKKETVVSILSDYNIINTVQHTKNATIVNPANPVRISPKSHFFSNLLNIIIPPINITFFL